MSVLGRCARTNQLGIAVCSSSMAVAARCAHVRPGVGVVASQNITDPRLGPALLDALAAGDGAAAAIDAVTAGRADIEFRQLAALDAHGRGGAYSGPNAMPVAGSRVGPDVVVAGNLLRGQRVLDEIVATFGADPAAELGARLLAALTAGLAAGGEHEPVHAAGLLIVGAVGWPTTDLRIDWSDADPVAALTVLWRRWSPQSAAFVQRALEPARAPGF